MTVTFANMRGLLMFCFLGVWLITEKKFPIVGQDFRVKCKVKGNPPPMIDWHKNDQSIVSNEKYVVEPDELLINNVTEIDDGFYKCTAVVLNTRQIETRNIKVEVQVPPKIQQVDEITMIEGEIASAKCTATGKPPPTYHWIKLKKRQDLAVTDRFKVKKNTGEFIINRVKFNDDGIYKCIAENTVARVETYVRINVLVKPKIYELLNVISSVTGKVEIICKSYGIPPPNVVFRKLSSREPFRVGSQLDDKRISLEQHYFEKREKYLREKF